MLLLWASLFLALDPHPPGGLEPSDPLEAASRSGAEGEQ